MVLPSLIGILLISRVWERYKDSPVVAVFKGIRPAVAGLIISVALTLEATVLTAHGAGNINFTGLIMAAVVFLAVYIKKIDPFKMIILCGSRHLLVPLAFCCQSVYHVLPCPRQGSMVYFCADMTGWSHRSDTVPKPTF